MVRPEEVNHVEGARVSVVVTRIPEGDMQTNLPEGDILLARDHSVEWVRADPESVPPQP
jgi:hypothetical protein